MFEVKKAAPDRVDVEIRGKLDAGAMEAGLDRLLEASEGVTAGRMLYRISEIAVPTMGALGVEFSRLPGLFGLLAKFDRCAVLSDVDWVRRVAEIEGAMIPGLRIKAFAFDAEAEAEAWLARVEA